jgi:hypothetical protein
LPLTTDLWSKKGEKSDKSSAYFGCMGNQVKKKNLKTKKQGKNIKNQKSLQKIANSYFKQNLVFAITSSTSLRTSSNANLYIQFSLKKYLDIILLVLVLDWTCN